eukprot:CAMPEP_0195527884 /NCGR_PEP_ID=MMETSP0794_2-20130614/29797_1 /TAXON_ID=515487 /ORGANISM="Stephanopyxis turris, Strain CCMP 815" /LENGTH=43 /DNA_ID= /DNA_START= /DNA_END= /DNA_ORIENTATION=
MTAFQSDVILVFDNAILYNMEGSAVYNMAFGMKNKFLARYQAL